MTPRIQEDGFPHKSLFSMPLTNTNLKRLARKKITGFPFTDQGDTPSKPNSVSSEQHESPHRTPFPMPLNTNTNLTRRPPRSRRRAELALPESEEDTQSLASTIRTEDTQSFDTATIETSASSVSVAESQVQRSFMDRCLWMRILYEQCGHVYSVSLHELPCSFSHHELDGILPEDSHAAQESRCADMVQYYVIKRKRVCRDCIPEKKKDWLGREREVQLRPEQKLARAVAHKRHDEWVKEVEAQKRRIAEKGKRLRWDCLWMNDVLGFLQ